MSKEQIKKEAAIFGLLCMIGYSMLLFATFIFAYLNPTYSVLVLINYYGEAHIELVAFFITIPLCIWSAYYCCRQIFFKKELFK